MATISGVWRWNDDISGAVSINRVKIQFRSNGFLFYGMLLYPQFSTLMYIPTQNMGDSADSVLSGEFEGPGIYDFDSGWYAFSDPYRTIDFGAWPRSVSDEFHTWLTTYLTYVGESNWKPVYQVSVHQEIWAHREAYQYINDEWVKISPVFRSYTVTVAIDNVDVEGVWLHTPTPGENVIAEDGTNVYYLSVKSDTEGTLPETISAINATVVEWDNTTGRLVVSNPTGDVTIQAAV